MGVWRGAHARPGPRRLLWLGGERYVHVCGGCVHGVRAARTGLLEVGHGGKSRARLVAGGVCVHRACARWRCSGSVPGEGMAPGLRQGGGMAKAWPFGQRNEARAGCQRGHGAFGCTRTCERRAWPRWLRFVGLLQTSKGRVGPRDVLGEGSSTALGITSAARHKEGPGSWERWPTGGIRGRQG